MASFWDYTYECMYYLNQYFRSTWPVKMIFGTQRRPPSCHTERKVLRIIYLLTHKKEPQESSLPDLIKELPANQDVFCIRDTYSGYNILQQCVISRRKDLVLLLLQKYDIKNLAQNNKCSPPLHVAAHLGLEGILELLLHHGYNCVEVSGMCYPEKHTPQMYVRWMGLMDSAVYACQKNVQIPIFCAIDQDNLNCVKILMNHMTESNVHLPSPGNLIHAACRRGSAECLEYFLHKYPDEVNTLNPNQDTPLLSAVIWGRKCVQLLLECGADPKKVSRLGETALHRLYFYDSDGLFTIYETSKYLLTNGVEQSINEINLMGDSPLHVLVTHVSYIGGALTHVEGQQPPLSRSELQEDYQKQVIMTLDLLLKFNADPEILDRNNLSPLNKLMHITFKSYEDVEPCVRTSINSRFPYRNDFNFIKKAVAILLEGGADVNTQCDMGHSPFILLLQCLLKMDLVSLCNQYQSILELAEVLLKCGAKCNFYCAEKGATSTVVASIAARYFDIRDLNVKPEICIKLLNKFASFIQSLLAILLQHGLNPNFQSSKKVPLMQGGCGNAIIEFVRLAEKVTCTEDFQTISQWLVTLFQWGADPDLEPYPSEPIICHSQSSIFLKQQATQPLNHCLLELNDTESLFDDDHAKDLLLLFYFSMSHKQLYDCLNSAQFMARFHPQGATGRDFLTLLTSLCEKPRSLKEMARVTIYKSLNRQLAEKVPLLPLPNTLKRYLLNIE